MYELIWYFIASVLAGIGTGFAGLSAATVMVPLLIVTCPSFQGETGAFQAAAIALASDFPGSAAAAYTYIKNGNIDLKRSRIMMICVLIFCVFGSCAAWLAGNVVLGSFTLFLTFFIGIRFLVKPDTSHDSISAKNKPLTLKEIVISVFFGVTIGFGTGFVGTGGGMMMLVVFTVFLGMELKTAVGTSTLIMTGTAAIACMSHILIHPAILTQRWPVLLFCMIISTLSSLISARFANRADNHTVGLITGLVLTVLGLVCLILRYRPVLMRFPIVFDTIDGLFRFILFYIPSIILCSLVYALIPVPSFVLRKLLHLIAFASITALILNAKTWQSCVLVNIVFALLIWPVLKIVEKEPWYSGLFVEKHHGEIMASMFSLFFTSAVVIAVGWGFYGSRIAAAAAVVMWGIGDGFAAIGGKLFGKHKNIPHADSGKSLEGSLACLIASFITGIIVFHFANHPVPCVRLLLCAAAGTIAELYSKNGNDTIIVPAVLIGTMILLKI